MIIPIFYPKHFRKVWGRELWIINTPLYCSKILYLNKGFRCSFHCHKLKTETFYIMEGQVSMRLEDQTFRMYPGDTITIEPGQKHSFSGLRNSKILEVSTQHFDSDSYREDESGKI